MGGTRMVSQGEVAKGDGLWNQKGKGLKEVNILRKQDKIKSVLLEDVLGAINEEIIIIKIDIEGYECKALTHYLNTEKKSKFIPYIFMEFGMIQGKFAEHYNCPQFSQLLHGFVMSGYEPFGPNRTSIEDLSVYKYVNLFWKHKAAKEVPYLVDLQTRAEPFYM